MQLVDFTNQIKDYYKSKHYKELLIFFKDNKGNFNEGEISNNYQIISNVLMALAKENHFDYGFKFLESYAINININTNSGIISSYGWVLYYKLKDESQKNNINYHEHDTLEQENEESDYYNQDAHINKTDLIIKIEELIKVIQGKKDDFLYLVFSKLFNLVVKTEKNKVSKNFKLINEFCNIINPELLSKICDSFENTRKGVTKKEEQASDYERWHAYKTKALFEIGNYNECLELSLRTLQNIDKFHYSNDVWLARRIALCNKKLGNIDNALEELNKVYRNKRDWYIEKEIAEIYFEKSNIDEALKFSLKAINNFGDIEFKIDLLILLGDIYLGKGNLDIAFKHYLLSKLIRQEKDWKIPNELIRKIELYSTDYLEKINYKDVLNELKKIWKSSISNGEREDKNFIEKGTGKIVKILHNNEKGADGFIEYNNIDSANNQIYFKLNSTDKLIPQIKIGFEVKFRTKFNKQKEEYYAIPICSKI